MSVIDQKEYLKKYLSGEDAKEKKKKRKKKAKTIGNRVKIIDDDLDNHIFNEAVQEDLNAANEDAPQIVGVIDDRPLELRMDDFKSENVWKSFSIGGDNKSSSDNESPSRPNKGGDFSPPRKENNGLVRKNQQGSDDDRSPPRRRVRDNRDSSRDGGNESRRDHKRNSGIAEDGDVRRNRYADDTKATKKNISPQRRRRSGSDTSPPRNRRIESNDFSPKINGSPPRRNNKDIHNSKIISDRRRSDSSPPRKRTDDDYSPPRKNRRENTQRIIGTNRRNSDSSPPRKRIIGDNSPQTKRRYENDASPPRKGERGSDNSPQSPARYRRTEFTRNAKDVDSNPLRKRPDDDYNSFPNKSRFDDDNSPPRKIARANDNNSSTLTRNDDDSSPLRRHRRDKDNSPSRRKRTDDYIPQRRNYEASTSKRYDNSPPSSSRNRNDVDQVNRENPRKQKKSRWGEPSTSADKLTKTLDGKTAGLQNAKDLVQETRDFKKREDDLFKNMSTEVSGANASTVMRDRKTGKIRDLGKEAEQKREKEKEKAAVKEKYDKWGKGVKQVEDYTEKLEQDVYEMSKPLARYADDEDLERYLKEQERDGDPMLAYIRKKKKKVAVESGKPLKPQYEGEFMPNRFGIRPGHKWDGVDRSNGYEKRWFEVINAKQAEREEIYKWSTEDM